jgi:hypothetical protein
MTIFFPAIIALPVKKIKETTTNNIALKRIPSHLQIVKVHDPPYNQCCQQAAPIKRIPGCIWQTENKSSGDK